MMEVLIEVLCSVDMQHEYCSSQEYQYVSISIHHWIEDIKLPYFCLTFRWRSSTDLKLFSLNNVCAISTYGLLDACLLAV